MVWYLIVTVSDNHTFYFYFIVTSVKSGRSVLCFIAMLVMSRTLYLYFTVTLAITTVFVIHCHVSDTYAVYFA